MLTEKPIYVGKALPKTAPSIQSRYEQVIQDATIVDADVARYLFASGILHACALIQGGSHLQDIAEQASTWTEGLEDEDDSN